MSALRFNIYEKDQGISYYTAEDQTLVARYSFGYISDDEYYAVTPELKCRDTACGALVCALAKRPLGYEVYGARFQAPFMSTDKLVMSVSTTNIKRIKDKIGVLHHLESYYGEGRTKVYPVLNKSGKNSVTKIIIEAPHCWVNSVPMLSFYLLLLRAFTNETGKATNFYEYAHRPRSDRCTDMLRLFSIANRINLPIFLANNDYIFGVSKITGWMTDEDMDPRLFSEEGYEDTSNMNYTFCAFMSYGITNFLQKTLPSGETKIGKAHSRRYQELIGEHIVKTNGFKIASPEITGITF